MALQVPLHSGSELKFRQAMWGPIYEAVLTLLGSTGSILPIGDPLHGKPNATTFTTVGEVQLPFTWSKAWATFDAHANVGHLWQGIIPVIDFDGVDEEADAADNDYWSAGADGTAPNEPTISIGAWIKLDADASVEVIMARNDVTTGDTKREWELNLRNGTQPQFTIVDDSAGAGVARYDATHLATEVWKFVVGTYSGNAANSGVSVYVDGVAVDDTNNGFGSYTAMENKGGVTTLGHKISADGVSQQFLSGKIAGGPMGPFFTQVELSADAVLRLYEIGRRALAL